MDRGDRADEGAAAVYRELTRAAVSGGLLRAGVVLDQQADEPIQLVVLVVEQERVDDRYLWGLDIDMPGVERSRNGSGSQLIGLQMSVSHD